MVPLDVAPGVYHGVRLTLFRGLESKYPIDQIDLSSLG